VIFQSTGGVNKTLPETVKTTLSQGPEYSNFSMKMYVKIIDDTNGESIFNIPTPIRVIPDITYSNKLLNDILSGNTTSEANKNLFSGDLRSASNVISSLSSLLNSQSFSDKNNLARSGKIFIYN
jgi:hypothetical protein